MSELAHDLRHALRLMRRNPGFAGVVILTLALGIGADTAIFSVVKATLLDALPYAEPERLVHVQLHSVEGPERAFEVSYPDFRDWRREAERFTGLAAVPTALGRTFIRRGGSSLQPVRAAPVSANLFRVLGVEPAYGRALQADDDVRGAAPIAVIGHGLWQRAFGGDPDAIGTTIELEGQEHLVVGVMPPEFEYPPGAELWTSLALGAGDFAENRRAGFLQVVGRLGPGVSAEAADQELEGLIETVSKPEWPAGADADVSLTPLRERLLGDLRTPLIVLLGAAGLVLLIACVNVANLLVARGVARGRELAIRVALGADGPRLLRQMLTENLVIALAGGALGVALAAAGTGLLTRLRGDELFRVGQADIDGGVLLFALGLSVLTALLFGLAPAWQGWRSSLVAGLRRREGGADGALAGRLRGGLVAVEVAVALVLLIGAGLLIRSLVELQRADTGFQREGILTAELFFPGPIYTEPPAWRDFYAGLIEEVETIGAVEAAAAVLIRPLEGPAGFDYPFTIEGQSETDRRDNPLLNYQAVTPEYFRTVGLPLLAGRTFREANREDAPGVVIVSRAMAERYWPDADPVGKRLKWGGAQSQQPWLTVVGVVADARYRGMASTRFDVYVPFTQTPWRLNHLVLRTAGAPTAVVPELRSVLARRDDRVEAVSVATVSELVHRSLSAPRSNTILLGVFAALALLLGGVGIYGVLASAVNQRRRELGVRMAMGASPHQVVRLVVLDALRLAAFGVVIGVPAALLLARVLQDLVYGVGVLDPLTFIAVPAFVLGVAIVASLVPAARASRVDPATVMRVE